MKKFFIYIFSLFVFQFIFLNFIKTNGYNKKNYTELNSNSNQDLKKQHSMYGDYPITRDVTGTNWVPDSSPYQGYYKTYKDWLFLLSGGVNYICDVQRGRRGGQKLVAQNQFFFTAQRDFDWLTLAFRSIFSLEGLTVGKCGMPSLLQTRFDCDGKTITDRQRPSTIFREFAITASCLLKEQTSSFLYISLIGLPAYGPPPSPDRYSGWYIPEYPIRSFWFGAFNVVTAGLIHKNLKWEISTFRGREPDTNKWYKIQKLKFDSYSLRLSYNPNENIALEISYAFLRSPYQFAPEINSQNFSFSAIYNKEVDDEHDYQLAAVFGTIDDQPGHFLPAVLLEGIINIKKSYFFARYEGVKEDAIIVLPDPMADKAVWLNKLTLAYMYDIVKFDHVRWMIGALCTIPILSAKLDKRYGNSFSYMLFTELFLVTD